MIQVVFHLNQIDNWSMVCTNCQNLLQECPQSQVKVVANGGAVKGYYQHDVRQLVERLKEQGVNFTACRHSLASAKLSEEQLPQYVETVPAGVVHLAELQQAGFAYIKP